MLRISRRADYAVRTMIAVADRPNGNPVPSPEIGNEMGIPQAFLVKVVGDLKRGGLLETVVGRGGGLKLAQSPGSITLRHIIESVDGPISIMPCPLRPEDCPKGNACPAHDLWAQMQQVICTEMDAISLAHLVAHRQRENDSQ